MGWVTWIKTRWFEFEEGNLHGFDSWLVQDVRFCSSSLKIGRSRLGMAMGTRNPMGFYSIRVQVLVTFLTRGFTNGHKILPVGFMGMGLFL